ncbi:Integrator complex subunit 9 [Nymphaea thermarum]|nr:Integrator complex subunit 9 [Nymphaea thermarum]
MVHICGLQILLECPLDLSAMRVFSPIPTISYRKNPHKNLSDHQLDKLGNVYLKSNKMGSGRIDAQGSDGTGSVFDAGDLIMAEPWYKMVPLHLWDVSMIDVVLISTPAGMLGLPFLTNDKRFNAKIYATEPVLKLGQLMMDELVQMHEEFIQCYGPSNSHLAQWMSLEELNKLPTQLSDIIMGEDFRDLANWRPLYGYKDVKECCRRVKALKYAEEACYDETLIIKPLSSGLEIGASNWSIRGPDRNFTYLCGSTFGSGHAKDFDYHSLRGNDLILFSDFSSLCSASDAVNCAESSNASTHRPDDNTCSDSLDYLFNTNEGSKEMDKLSFICSCAIGSLQSGGSVLISIGRVGVLLQLIEQMQLYLESSGIKLYNGEALFGHVELVKGKRIHLLPSVHSPDLPHVWKEPCIVFSSHWNLRIGPVVHLLRRWREKENCLLVLEFPECLQSCSTTKGEGTSLYMYYSEQNTLKVPCLRENFEADLATDLAFQLQPRRLRHENIAVARLEGGLVLEEGRYSILPLGISVRSSENLPLHWSAIDPNLLVAALKGKGISCSIEGSDGLDCLAVVHVHEPQNASIQISNNQTLICTNDEMLRTIIYESISSVLDSI